MEAKELVRWRRSCGILVAEFANSVTTDKAAFKYFENINNLFGFSPQFIESAKSAFPSIERFDLSFSKQQLEALKLLADIVGTIEENEPYHIGPVYIWYVKEDKKFHIFEEDYRSTGVVIEDEYGDVHKDLERQDKEYYFSLSEMERFLLENVGEKKAKIIINDFRDLIGLYDQRDELLNLLPKQDLAVTELIKKYKQMQKEHAHIDGVIKNLTILFEEITDVKKISDSPMLARMLHRYNMIKKTRLS